MGNSYKPPEVEKRNNTVVKQVNDESTADRTIGISSTNAARDASDIYKKNIDQFSEFLQGKTHSGTLEERQKFQLDFFKGLPEMLRLDDAKVKAILDHFLITIAENRTAFEYSSVMAPMFTLKSRLPAADVERYEKFMLFITMFSDNARDRKRFLAMFDMTKFTNMFDPITKQRLTNYVHR